MYADKIKTLSIARDANWRTPPAIFEALHRVFSFTVDACAMPDNALLPRYWTPETDCVNQSWLGERVFCNPSPSEVFRILPRCDSAELTCVLLPLPSLFSPIGHKYPPRLLAIPNRKIPLLDPLTKCSGPAAPYVFAMYGEIQPEHVAGLHRQSCRVYAGIA